MARRRQLLRNVRATGKGLLAIGFGLYVSDRGGPRVTADVADATLDAMPFTYGCPRRGMNPPGYEYKAP